MSFLHDFNIGSIYAGPTLFSHNRLFEITCKSLKAEPLDAADISFLLSITRENEQALFDAARKVKEAFHGNVARLFVPLYLSNECSNNCIYCGFRSGNQTAVRKTLSIDEVMVDAELLYREGHRNFLLVTAENADKLGGSFIVSLVDRMKNSFESLPTVNLNYPPVSIDEFRLIAGSGIDAYQSFQETYDKPTYHRVHPDGVKADYAFRLETFDRACSSGIQKIGAGVLLGLHDYKNEITALLQHMNYLNDKYPLLPGTISVPRLRPAENMNLNEFSHIVTDEQFCRIIATVRLALPLWDIAVSTRETPEMRMNNLFQGATMLSAGSVTDPGGYSHKESATRQFELEEVRQLSEVMKAVKDMGLRPELG